MFTYIKAWRSKEKHLSEMTNMMNNLSTIVQKHTHISQSETDKNLQTFVSFSLHSWKKLARKKTNISIETSDAKDKLKWLISKRTHLQPHFGF